MYCCRKEFTNVEVFREHKKIHRKESIFCCINCLYYANTLGELLHHKIIHVRERMEKRLKEEGRSDDLWQQKLVSVMNKLTVLRRLEMTRIKQQKFNIGKYNLRSLSKVIIIK